MRLKNRVALVTGAGKGIGKAIALQLANEGANVVVNYSSSEKAAHAVAEEVKKCGSHTITIKCDVSSAQEVNVMVQEVIHTFGKIDILVNNAGAYLPAAFDDITPEIWEKTINTNLKGTFHCIKAVGKEMKKQKSGKIVNISSVSSIIGSVASAAYAASKAGIDGLTKTLAKEFGKYNITVNSVAPGPVGTDLLLENLSEEIIQQFLRETPLGRIATPEDIAKVVLFFASDDSNFVNGQTLIVDGGRIIR